MNGYSGGYIPPDYFIVKENERRKLKKTGSLCGIAICGYVLLQNVIVLLIQLAGLGQEYSGNDFFKSGADIIITFASVLVPFALASVAMRKHTGIEDPLLFGRRTGMGSVILAVIGGTGLCLGANIVASMFIVFAQAFGFSLTSPDVPMATGAVGMFMSFVRVSLVAAMAEELALRGYVMGNLRQYGDTFAISACAVMFALMHGNMVQAPFALMAGFLIGYFTVKTGTMWTGIIIHALNNMISLVASYIMEFAGEETGALLYAFIVYSMSIIGIISTFIFIIRNKDKKLDKGYSILSTAEKVSSFFVNVPMFVAFAVMFYITSTFVEFGG